MNTQIEIIPPNQFKTVPWKNGLGETIEVAINQGGTLNHFDWRLSMASVVEDGEFSNFEGYTRNLILIDGNGINLQHNDSKIDKLSHLLDIATFDGGNKTIGNLHAGDITDFNVITRTDCINVKVVAKAKLDNYALETANTCFVYSLFRAATLLHQQTNNSSLAKITLPAQHLLKLSLTPALARPITLSGTHLIIVYINEK